MINYIYKGNDNALLLSGLKNYVADTYINDATVAVTLLDDQSTEVAGETWPLSMTYVTASNGDYRATLSKDVSIVDGLSYKAKVTADGGTGLYAEFYCGLECIDRACS